MSALPYALRLTCCRSWLLLICLVFLASSCSRGASQDRLTLRLLHAGDDLRGSTYGNNNNNNNNDDDDENVDAYDEEEDFLEENITAGESQEL